MSEGNKYRTGPDDRPLTPEEFQRVREGGALYARVTAEPRPETLRQEAPRSAKALSKRAVSLCASS